MMRVLMIPFTIRKQASYLFIYSEFFSRVPKPDNGNFQSPKKNPSHLFLLSYALRAKSCSSIVIPFILIHSGVSVNRRHKILSEHACTYDTRLFKYSLFLLFIFINNGSQLLANELLSENPLMSVSYKTFIPP